MPALFDLNSAIFVLLLTICTATYVRYFRPSYFHRDSEELHKKLLYKCSVLGDRLSVPVAVGCFLVAVRTLLFS